MGVGTIFPRKSDIQLLPIQTSFYPFILLLSLQGRLATTDTEAIHQQHELVLNAVREKAAYASQNLYSAAEKADQSIR